MTEPRRVRRAVVNEPVRYPDGGQGIRRTVMFETEDGEPLDVLVIDTRLPPVHPEDPSTPPPGAA